VASAVHVNLISQPSGVTPTDIVTTRLDGVNMRFSAALGGMTLGSVLHAYNVPAADLAAYVSPDPPH